MVELDLDDFLEEIKFYMSDHIELERETILDWEAKARRWVDQNATKQSAIHVKKPEEIMIKIKNEDVMEEIAEQFFQAYRKERLVDYWKKFKLI